MESIAKPSADEQAFIEFLISYIVDKDAKYMRTDLAKVSAHIQKEYGAKDPLNLYRKQFGNLKDCVQKDATKRVFELEGTNFKFVHHTKVEEAYTAGIFSEAAWNKFQAGRTIFLTHTLTMAKGAKQNICKICECTYFVTANKEGTCNKGNGAAHVP